MLPCPRGAVWVGELGRGAELDACLVAWRGQRCVLKRPRPDRIDLAARLAEESLSRDAQALELLAGRGAPRLLDVGRDEAGPFTLQALAEGRSLAAWLDAGGGSDARRLALQVVELVSTLGARTDARGPLGLAHGDLAPEHLFVASEGLTAIDFGAASWRDVPPRADHRGTPPFSAPELVRGEAASSPATDRYAAGVLVATLLAGRPPLRADEPSARLLEIGDRGHDVASLGTLPGPIARALGEVLAFAPRDRAADLTALRDALATSLGA